MPNTSKRRDDLTAPLNAIVDRLLSEAGASGVNCAVKVWSWVDDDGEHHVGAKAIPYDQLYVTYEPAQPWPSSVTASTPALPRAYRAQGSSLPSRR